jgi:integrase
MEILKCLQTAGVVETAHIVKQLFGQVARYAIAIAIGEGDRDVSADLRGALKPSRREHRSAAKTPQEAKAVMRGISTYHGGMLLLYALNFSAYTFCRPGEIRHAEWTEIDFEAREWRIPAEKMKARRVHIVPLADQVIQILRNVQTLTGHGRYVFPNARTLRHGERAMSENAVTAALRRMGFEKDQLCAHGFRAMASTILNEQGWTPDVIERQLAHVEGNSVRAAYNHAEHLPQRREMMQHWANWLDGLR